MENSTVSSKPEEALDDVPAPAAPYDKGLKLYGKKAALTIEATFTKDGFPTITIEAASGSGKTFEWHRKTSVQITRDELPLLACVLLGLKPSVEFSNHGSQQDKVLLVEHQGANIFIKVIRRGEAPRALPVNPSGTFELAALVLRQLAAAAKISVAEVLPILKVTTAKMSVSAPRNAGPGLQ